MQRMLFLFSCVTAVTRASFSDASIAQTQQYLQEWNLHDHLGDEFLALHYDGRYLKNLDISDYDRELFPRATRAHWKVLLNEIARAQPTERRRLAVMPDLKDYKGLRIKNDKAFLTLGKAEDVKIVRTGPGQLAMTGGLSADMLSTKKLTFNGKAVDINLLVERVNKLEAAAKVLKDKNTIALGDSGDVSLTRTGSAQSKLTGDLTVEKGVSAHRVKASQLLVNGPVRISDDIRMAYPGTIGYVFAKGVLKPGQSSPAKYSNPNYWAGNGKISITVCSMHTEGTTGGGNTGSDHVYKVYWNSHGQPYNHYSQPMLKHLKSSDGKLTLTDGAGCVFKNGHEKHEAYYVVKQLPITSFVSTRHAAKGTGAWSI